MKNAKALNVKNMKETLVNYSAGCYEDYEKMWNTFREMRMMGFISTEVWNKFFDQTKSWTIVDGILYDTEKEKMIFDFDNRNGADGNYKEYRA